MRAKRLTVQQRRQIFRDLVDTQDEGSMSVRESEQHVMEKFSISETQLESIIDEGTDKDWPPLNEPAQKAG